MVDGAVWGRSLDRVADPILLSWLQDLRRERGILLDSQPIVGSQADRAPSFVPQKFPTGSERPRRGRTAPAPQTGFGQQVGIGILPDPFHPAPVHSGEGCPDALALEN